MPSSFKTVTITIFLPKSQGTDEDCDADPRFKPDPRLDSGLENQRLRQSLDGRPGTHKSHQRIRLYSIFTTSNRPNPREWVMGLVAYAKINIVSRSPMAHSFTSQIHLVSDEGYYSKEFG
jgi:hypothetical protein